MAAAAVAVVEPEDSVSGLALHSVELALRFAVGPEHLIAEPHFAVD